MMFLSRHSCLLRSFRPIVTTLIGGAGLAGILGGCTQLRSFFDAPKLPGATLQLQVLSSQQPGVYDISGQTDFPNQSEIRVAAVRYLYPTRPTTRDPKPTYSVLAYRTAKITEGKWQASLNLWQVAKDGRFQESWQINQQKLKLPVKPASDVVFLATLAPGNKADQVQWLEQQLQSQKKTLGSELISSNTEGQRYIRVSKPITISLPTGKTTPPAIEAKDINGGWGNRFLMPPEPPIPYTLEFPKERRTNAPAAPAEYMR